MTHYLFGWITKGHCDATPLDYFTASVEVIVIAMAFLLITTSVKK